MVVSILLGFVGNVLLGIAVWRSGILPKGAGALLQARYLSPASLAQAPPPERILCSWPP
jgi:hypothetical protein